MSDIKIVIARYEEPVNWINDLKHDFLIYNKGTAIQDLDIPQNSVIQIPNKGREAETYLRYITDNYHEIPQAVAFLQGHPFDHCPNVLELIEKYDFSDGILSLGNPTFSYLHGGPSYPGLDVGSYRNEIIPGHSDSETIDFIAGAQFIIRADLIKNKPLSWWKQVSDLYDRYWFSNIESGYGRPPGEFIAHVFERLWPSIFKYIPDGK